MAARTKVPADINDFVHLSFFAEIGKAIVAAKSMREILERVMENIGSIFAPLNWSLLLADTASEELVFKIAIGEAGPALVNKRIPADEGIGGWIYRTGQPLIVQNVAKDPRFSGRIDRLTGFKTKSIIGVPLKTNDKTIGVIELINKLNGKPFTPLELKLLSTIADFAAIAIERQFSITALRRISRTDYLTGAQNRRSFDGTLALEIERCKRHSTILSLLIIDIDNFKRINDRFGHPAGDKVLKSCAEIILSSVRKIDTVARYGGDEFAVLMPNTGRSEAEVVKNRILTAIETYNRERRDLPFEVTIGLHSAGPEGLGDIIGESDLDMYRNKEQKEPGELGPYLLQMSMDEAKEE